MRIAAVIVTRNRIELLKKCVYNIKNQSRRPDGIIVINNKSDDGTKEWLDKQNDIIVVHSDLNGGGSGGQYQGFQLAKSMNFDWIWTMDDDCEPDLDAIKEFEKINPQNNSIYGSVAVDINNSDYFVWRNSTPDNKVYERISELPNEIIEINAIPFLGMFVPLDVINLIGLPQKDLFLYDDDGEYCKRARHNGIRLFYIARSIIKHPCPEYVHTDFLGKKITYIKIDQIKILYSIRNTIYIEKKYSNSKPFFYMIRVPKVLISTFFHIIFVRKLNLSFVFLCYKAIFKGLDGELGEIMWYRQ